METAIARVIPGATPAAVPGPLVAPTKARPVAPRVAVRAPRETGDQAACTVAGPVITGSEPRLPPTRPTSRAATEAEAHAGALGASVSRAPTPGDPPVRKRARRAAITKTDAGREGWSSARRKTPPLQRTPFLAPERGAGAGKGRSGQVTPRPAD